LCFMVSWPVDILYVYVPESVMLKYLLFSSHK
jgi:hypothetical protein